LLTGARQTIRGQNCKYFIALWDSSSCLLLCFLLFLCQMMMAAYTVECVETRNHKSRNLKTETMTIIPQMHWHRKLLTSYLVVHHGNSSTQAQMYKSVRRSTNNCSTARRPCVQIIQWSPVSNCSSYISSSTIASKVHREPSTCRRRKLGSREHYAQTKITAKSECHIICRPMCVLNYESHG
jgi:hypothetical protein